MRETNTHSMYCLFVGALNALVRTNPKTQQKQHRGTDRKAAFTQYEFRGTVVCQKVFQFVNGLRERRLKLAKAAFLKEGVHELVHGNVQQTSHVRAFSVEGRQKAVRFILNFAQNNGLVLPGRLPGYRNNSDLLLLPSTMTKTYVYDKYRAVEKQNPMGRRLWYLTWRQFCSNVVIQRPRSDLCSICQHAVTSMGRLAGFPEHIKRERIEESLGHLELVDRERCYYRHIIETCKERIAEVALYFSHIPRPPCSWDGTLHISFDYAQQILLPCSGQQVGPIYFLAGYKVGLFGVAIEPLHKFVLYIIPEACNTGKGANTVISLLHHFFEHFGLGASSIVCHADNCAGQNKNRYMLQYLTWRVLKQLHANVQLSFLLTGHTKFAPDLYFGLFKRRLSISRADCVKDVARIALEATSISQSITPVLVGTEQGETFIPTYDWSSFFHSGKTVPQITKQHHFRMTSLEPGVVGYREFENSQEKSTTIFAPSAFRKNTLPTIIDPIGLSPERRKYLFNQIRPYIKCKYQNLVCPNPAL